ncbi:MAG: VTT domain-containing protein [Rhodoluna sp.]|jgi:membrane-associated protein|nr:VTT domain-containing protein [Rhodoluna sp.]MBP7818501.1 VTT domain-containing protein [Rhodoluna sp.]
MFGMDWLKPETLITSFGAFAMIGVMLIVFIETGLLVGFFLPGDSLLFVTGLMVASGAIQIPWGDSSFAVPIWLACVLISSSAWLGDQTGYWIGRRVGPAIFNKPESKLFSHENVSRTNSFFERYGARAIILAHFVPVMRTFVPVAAGVGEMPYRKFLRYNFIGVIGWGTGVTLLGFFLGKIPFVAEHVEYFTIGFVIISTIPIVIEVVKARRDHQREQLLDQ